MTTKEFKSAFYAVNLAIQDQLIKNQVPYPNKTERLALEFGKDITNVDHINQVVGLIDWVKLESVVD